MAGKRRFEIAFVGLKPGIHEFNYELDKEFFSERGATDLQDIKAEVKVELEKSPGLMLLKFHVGGSAEVLCDRCGNPGRANLWDEFTMVVKPVDDPEAMNENEEDPDVFYISRTESHLDLGAWLYEFAMLSIPGQYQCGTDAEGKSLCNPEVLKKLGKMHEDAEREKNNPFRKELEKFKNN